MYSRILVGLDGSKCSDHAGDASIDLAKSFGCKLVACHVYAAQMHRARFGEMEIGLPQRYQKPERLEHLRDTHEDIISGGMKIISDAYLAPFIAKASATNLEVDPKTPEGRNYVEFLKVQRESSADLTVVGADGQGKVQESNLGSFAERALLLGGKDLLIMRRAWEMRGRTIVVGVDGSEYSYAALSRAAGIAAVYGNTVHAVAVYDPFFHSSVFTSISAALTKEQASKFNFAAQERLHDEIIDDGLRALYEKKLETGIARIASRGIAIKKEVVTGKIFTQLAYYASLVNAGLLIVGRHGVHRESPSIIGSTAHALARISPANLLVVGVEGDSEPARMTATTPVKIQEPETRSSTLETTGLAEEAPEAQMVTLKKAKRLAPAFHEHIVRARIVGSRVAAGTKFMVFDVVGTVPSGTVIVTERTRLEFI